MCAPYYYIHSVLNLHIRSLHNGRVQRDLKRWTQFRTSIFPELYMICE